MRVRGSDAASDRKRLCENVSKSCMSECGVSGVPESAPRGMMDAGLQEVHKRLKVSKRDIKIVSRIVRYMTDTFRFFTYI